MGNHHARKIRAGKEEVRMGDFSLQDERDAGGGRRIPPKSTHDGEKKKGGGEQSRKRTTM